MVEELECRLSTLDSPDKIAKFDQVKNLSHLDAVTSEVLRYGLTIALGLQRLVYASSATVCGGFFKEGVVSVSCPGRPQSYKWYPEDQTHHPSQLNYVRRRK